jgi:hypothetical protein
VAGLSPYDFIPPPFGPDGTYFDAESRSPQSPAGGSSPTGTFGGLPGIPGLPSFTSIFPVSGASCKTASGDNGVCLSQTECDNQGGSKDGNCNTILFNSAGVCCSFLIKKCSDTAIRSPLMWQVPPRAANKMSCTLTFPANPGITVAGTTVGGGLTSASNDIRSCQLKVEFQSFRLTGPNPETTLCEEDYFSVTGSALSVPKLCGDAYADQHMFIPFNAEQDDITLGFFLSDASNKDWKLKITRLPCSSKDLAPVNCLQYFTRDAGQIESFNFKQETAASVRQLADQNYNMCFKRSTGYCSICYTPCPTVKNVPGFLLTKNLNDTSSATSGSKCADQLIIPGGNNGGTSSIHESVFCGGALNIDHGVANDGQICTTSDRITYMTDSSEDPSTEANNVGFCLSYIQKKC